VDDAWWESIYRQAFPNFAGMVAVRQDGWAQRGAELRLLEEEKSRRAQVPAALDQWLWHAHHLIRCYVRDPNHCLRKTIVEEAVRRNAVIKLKDLTGIRDRLKRFSHTWNRKVNA
jgi:hypothetical protein